MKYFLPILLISLGALAVWLFLNPPAPAAKSNTPSGGYKPVGPAIYPQNQVSPWAGSGVPGYIVMPDYILLNNNPKVGIA